MTPADWTIATGVVLLALGSVGLLAVARASVPVRFPPLVDPATAYAHGVVADAVRADVGLADDLVDVARTADGWEVRVEGGEPQLARDAIELGLIASRAWRARAEREVGRG